MGKETKMGLAVIAALLIVLGVVVAVRVMNSSTETAAAEDAATAASGEADDSSGATASDTEGQTSPTVVTASAASSEGSGPAGSGDTSRWAIAGDEADQATDEADAAAAPTPPSYMPKPMAAAANPAYGDAVADPSTAPENSWGTASGATAQGEPSQPGNSPSSSQQDQNGHAYSSQTGDAVDEGSSSEAITTFRPPPESEASQDPNPLRSTSADGQAADEPNGSPRTTGQLNDAGSSPLSQGGQSNSGYSSPTRTYQNPSQTAGGYGRYNATQQADAATGSGSYAQGAESGYGSRNYDTAGAAGSALTAGGGTTTAADTPGGQQDDGTYVLQPNDSYWAVCEKLYGTGAYFQALSQYNAERHPEADRLKVGDTILAPSKEVLREAYPELCPKPAHVQAARRRAMAASTTSGLTGGRVYVVEEGDTLYDIARVELGRADRWVEIYQLNREVLGDDFDYLTPGTRLALPRESQTPSSITRHPGSGYQR